MIAYVEGSVIGVPNASPTGQNPVIFINSFTGDGVTDHPPGVWSNVDLSAIVPAGTTAVRLDGILIITHGTTVETADLTVAFRADPSWEYGYIMQTIEAAVGGGQRSNAGAWVALDANRCFEMKWTRATLGQWPANSSYGINLSLTAYLKPGVAVDLTSLNSQIAALSQQVATLGAPVDLTAVNADIALLNQQILQMSATLSTLQSPPPAVDPRIGQIIDFVKQLP